MTPPARSCPPRGFVLLVVLMAVGLLSLLTAQLTASARTDAVIAARLRDVAMAEAAAEGGIADAAFVLLTGGKPAQALAAGEPLTVTLGAARVRLSVPAPRVVVNPNADPPLVLASGLRDAGVEPSLAPRIADAMRGWHATGGVRAADDDAYRRAGLRYGASHTLFASADEVGLVLGMTPAAFALIRPHVALYGAGAMADPRPGGIGVPGQPEARILTVTATATIAGTTASRTATLMLRDEPDADETPFAVLDWTHEETND